MIWSIIFYFCRLFFIFFLSFFFSLLPAYYCILVNQKLLINLLYYNFKRIFLVYSIISISYYCCLSYISPQFLFHYCSFEYVSEVRTFPIDTTDILIQGWHLIVWYFPFHGLHFATTLKVLKSVLCFHMVPKG